MSHLRTFVANQVLSRIRAFLGVFCPDFYSDIEDFTHILCRYLSKISAAGTSEPEVSDPSLSQMWGRQRCRQLEKICFDRF